MKKIWGHVICADLSRDWLPPFSLSGITFAICQHEICVSDPRLEPAGVGMIYQTKFFSDPVNYGYFLAVCPQPGEEEAVASVHVHFGERYPYSFTHGPGPIVTSLEAGSVNYRIGDEM